MMSSARGRLAGRRIVVERRLQRGLGRSLLSRTPLVPASEVPEDLVEEVSAYLLFKLSLSNPSLPCRPWLSYRERQGRS